MRLTVCSLTFRISAKSCALDSPRANSTWLIWSTRDISGVADAHHDQWNAPALFAAGGDIHAIFDSSVCRYQVNPRGFVPVTGDPVTAAAFPAGYNASYNEFVPVDPTGGAVLINAPDAKRSFGDRITLKDVAGTASPVNSITLATTFGNTIDSPAITTPGGSKTWACCDPTTGVGVWHLISSV